MRVVISGGHLTPAYSFAEVAVSKGDSLLLIGSAGPDSLEATELAKLKVKYFHINSVKFDRHHRLSSILRTPTILVSIFKSIQILRRFRAQVAVTFGSFNAVPIGLAAKILGLPLIIHEQTRAAGLANRLLTPLANSCAVSYSDSLPFFPASKTSVVGNPIRSVFWHPPQNFSLKLPTTKPIIYITGGNQGSAAILQTLNQILPDLYPTYQLIIQSGNTKNSLDLEGFPHIIAKPWFEAEETAYILNHAYLIISRGGANTIAEIMVAGAPSIIIPIPYASHDEQTQNAHLITSPAAGLLMPQSKLSPESLLTAIRQLVSDYPNFSSHAATLSSLQNPHAAAELYSLVRNTVGT